MDEIAEPAAAPTPTTWLSIIADAYALFDDLRSRGFGEHPFSLGGGTVLMLDYEHRLSKDIDLFAYDVQWLGLLSPRLNGKAAALSLDYVEQANSVKIVTKDGDIDFVVARDVTSFDRRTREIAGRWIPVEPAAEILAKKLFYRAAGFKPRDVYDMAAAIDLAPATAAAAVEAAISTGTTLLRRLDELAESSAPSLLRDILPYDGVLRHAGGMVAKVRDFVVRRIDEVRKADTPP